MPALEINLAQRMKAAVGQPMPGDNNYLADVIEILADEMRTWTNRADDAQRIPERLRDCSRFFRLQAKLQAEILGS